MYSSLYRNHMHKFKTPDLAKPNADFTLLDCRVEVPSGSNTIPGVPHNLPLNTPGFPPLIYSNSRPSSMNCYFCYLRHQLKLPPQNATRLGRRPGKYVQTLSEKRQNDDRNMTSVVGRSTFRSLGQTVFFRVSTGIRLADTL
jgi:hypothetical protein